MKILIRNLSRRTSEERIRKLFEPFGDVTACDLVLDAKTGKSKGFGFVEMPSEAEGREAIKKLNGACLEGAAIRVKLSRK